MLKMECTKAFIVHMSGSTYVQMRKGHTTSFGATNMPQKRKDIQKRLTKLLSPSSGLESMPKSCAIPSYDQSMTV